MNSLRSNNVSLKYQRFTTLGSKDIGVINSEFVTKTQFLYNLSFVETWMNPWWEKQPRELASLAQEPSYLRFHHGSPGNESSRCPGGQNWKKWKIKI